MFRIVSAVLIALIAIITLIVRAGDTKVPDPVSPVTITTIAYGDDPAQVADLYLPSGLGPFPVVVFVHGGFWRDQFTRDLMEPLARDAAARGYAAWNIEFRRVGKSGGGWPTTFEDVAAAVDRLRDIPNIDTQRVAFVGHSSGGQLALWAAGRVRLPAGAPGAEPQITPCGVVALSPIADLVAGAEEGTGGTAVVDFLGGTPVEIPTVYDLASPAELAPLGVPVRLVHPVSDGIVPLSQSERFVSRANPVGEITVLIKPSGDHFDPLNPSDVSWVGNLAWLAQNCGQFSPTPAP